ncbi:MAG: hypothetical protein V2A65_08215 [Candidatus Omnitrophota bacterium]
MLKTHNSGGSTAGFPAAVTGSATAIASSSATLTGTINPDGLVTTYYFQYGLVSGGGTQDMVTRSVDAGSGTDAVSVNAQIFSLSPGTNYYYYVVGMNRSGVSYGDAQFFTTESTPQMGKEPFGGSTLQ